MTDTINIDTPRGRVEIRVQTKDIEAHAKLSNGNEDYQQARQAIQWLVRGLLEGKES